MLDMDRGALTEMVYRRLSNPSFRERLTARAPDGSHPLVLTTGDELMSSVLQRLEAIGGSGNVVAPMLNGLVVLAVNTRVPDEGGVTDEQPAAITADCTVGVFIERMRFDGAGLYRLMAEGTSPSLGRAEVVAVAG